MKIICTKEEKGTKALPITYEEVKKYSDNLFALLDDLKEVKKNEVGRRRRVEKGNTEN